MTSPGYPRFFKTCPKCRQPGSSEGMYVSKQTEKQHAAAIDAIGSWPYKPEIPLDSLADEGFYVRCCFCSFAWYEPLEVDDEVDDPPPRPAAARADGDVRCRRASRYRDSHHQNLRDPSAPGGPLWLTQNS